MTGPIDKHTGRAADEVVRRLAEKIQAGEYADGQTLPPERYLMEEYGISRTVVREAVQSLSRQGLLETRPRYRPIVRKPGFDAAISALESVDWWPSTTSSASTRSRAFSSTPKRA